MANLAAHLCGYTVFKISPSPIASAVEYKMDSFKADLVNAYMKAGVKVCEPHYLYDELVICFADIAYRVLIIVNTLFEMTLHGLYVVGRQDSFSS